MNSHDDREARVSLARIMPRLEERYGTATREADWRAFTARLETNFADLFHVLLRLYGSRYDFFYHLENVVGMAARMWLARPEPLRDLDARSESDPFWYQSQTMVGGVCYVDLFAGTLDGVRRRIAYFQELGLTYLHLMPLFLAPEGNSDGGYAVSSYRDVNPALGSMDQLASLAADLRAAGITLVLDFVFNHTSDEHTWARRALAGDEEYQDYYYMFPDRAGPDAYQRTLRDIFPDQRPGSFTYRQEIDRWVWTTFNSFQWDLNYANPAVFTAMAEEMLFLANQGAAVLRLDAVAFSWKQMGTACENLPEAHLLVQAFNALTRIAAPALLFKSEAIVHPDEVARYIAPHECHLSYNPLLMALLWEALATREVRLLRHSMQRHLSIDRRCAWVNYVRVHDDIGWTFDDGDAAALGINAYDHRRFLNAYYTGRFPGSFAAGVPFQENPRTGDARVSGTCASLAGLEQALREDDERGIELSVKRILLLHSIILSIGGIPLIYLGDEVGTLNDYGYRDDPRTVGDSRWVHRPTTDWAKVARRADADAVEARIFSRLTHLIHTRKGCAPLAGGETTIIDSGNGHVLAYLRHVDGAHLLVLANFSEHEQRVPVYRTLPFMPDGAYTDLVTGRPALLNDEITMGAYECGWFIPTPA